MDTLAILGFLKATFLDFSNSVGKILDEPIILKNDILYQVDILYLNLTLIFFFDILF